MLPIPPRRPLLLAVIIALLTMVIVFMMTSCSTRRTFTQRTTTHDSLHTEIRTDTTHLTITQSDLTQSIQTTHTRDSIVIEEWFALPHSSIVICDSSHPHSSIIPCDSSHPHSSIIPCDASYPHSSIVDCDASQPPATPTLYRRTTAILQSDINLAAQRQYNLRLDSIVNAHAALLARTRAIEDSIATSSTTGTASLTPHQLALSRYSNLLIVILLISSILFCLYSLINRMK